MDIRQLKYFLAIVDHGRFNRAAVALYVSQPSLSQAVRALESDLGSELFHRIGRRAVLTEAGKALIEPARAAVRSLETARASVASVHELRTGRLDVASMPSQAVEPLTTLIRAFSERHPGVVVAVKAVFSTRDVADAVRTGAVEAVLAGDGPAGLVGVDDGDHHDVAGRGHLGGRGQDPRNPGQGSAASGRTSKTAGARPLRARLTATPPPIMPRPTTPARPAASTVMTYFPSQVSCSAPRQRPRTVHRPPRRPANSAPHGPS